ncbi:MAG: metallophosphatase [Bacteroides sp.]|nr:metallophosphatase [Roseburia sp.]MCM1346897.1 metallophosphatase [Bacteroides sp.]MCM1420624.1 metallophosphatase [Bacteroides sp.]
MNRFFSAIAGAAVFFSCCFVEILAQDNVADKNILVVHTNDTHSCIMPINPNYADTLQANKGGYLRRAALVAELRKEDPELLLFDCGDFSQGSPYYNIFKGDVEVSLMNYMKYDACTIGNHEFDFGLENMARIFRMADFPVVCCNYDFTGTVLQDIVKPYVILSREGLKIGVLGVSPKLEGLVSGENYKGVEYLDPIGETNKVAEYLKLTEGCDLIICLSHLGWGGAEMDDARLIRGTRYIDAVIGGHSHTYFTKPEYVVNADGQSVVCNQMGKNGRFVGTLVFEMVPEWK